MLAGDQRDFVPLETLENRPTKEQSLVKNQLITVKALKVNTVATTFFCRAVET